MSTQEPNENIQQIFERLRQLDDIQSQLEFLLRATFLRFCYGKDYLGKIEQKLNSNQTADQSERIDASAILASLAYYSLALGRSIQQYKSLDNNPYVNVLDRLIAATTPLPIYMQLKFLNNRFKRDDVKTYFGSILSDHGEERAVQIAEYVISQVLVDPATSNNGLKDGLCPAFDFGTDESELALATLHQMSDSMFQGDFSFCSSQN